MKSQKFETTQKTDDRTPVSRMPGSGSKDSRHGLNTDRSTDRRSESRRQGSMGSESKPKSARKNV